MRLNRLVHLGYVDEVRLAVLHSPHEDFDDYSVSGPVDEDLLMTGNSRRMDEAPRQTYRSGIQAERSE